MVIFHKYILIKTAFETEFELEIACISALFIATKICNFLVSISRISQTYIVLKKSLYNKNNDEKSINSTSLSSTYIQNCISETELEILDYIGFDVNIDLPYPFIDKMKPYLNKIISDQKLIKIIFNFINDSFKLPIILNYSPLKIAITCIYMLELHFKIELKDVIIDKNYNVINVVSNKEVNNSSSKDAVNTKNTNIESECSRISWYKYLLSDIDFSEIVEISSIINFLYTELKKVRSTKTNCKENLSIMSSSESNEFVLFYNKNINNFQNSTAEINNNRYPILGFDFLNKKRAVTTNIINNSSIEDTNINKLFNYNISIESNADERNNIASKCNENFNQSNKEINKNNFCLELNE